MMDDKDAPLHGQAATAEIPVEYDVQATEDGRVVLLFSLPLRWAKFSPAQALQIAEKMQSISRGLQN